MTTAHHSPSNGTSLGTEPFVRFLGRVLPGIEDEIRRRFPRPYEQSQSACLERYIYEPLRRLVFAGGKRIRPALCLLGASAVAADEARALPVACSVELFQAAALVHDDIADKSELRRGVPCLHLTEGTGIAINAGDMGIVDVIAHVLLEESYDPTTRLELLREIYDLERCTLEGQALDLGWVRDERWDLTEDDYLTMATLKTAHYSCASPLVLGALCGSPTPQQITALRRFGLDAGLAFQIQDDLLNLTGNAEAQGKDFMSDITEGKRTLVMVRALQRLDERDADELRSILSQHATEEDVLLRAVELARSAGALDYARDYALGLVGSAKKHLANAQISHEAHDVLVSMANYFVGRES